MSQLRWPIAVTAAGDVSAGVCLWRQQGRMFATVAVKATFTLVPGKAMVLREPLPIEPEERPAAPGTGIDTPGDLAPCLRYPEIWVRGHARRPPAPGAPSLRVRLAVARDATLLIAKEAEIPVPSGPFIPPFLHNFAPLSRRWPVRTRLLDGIDPSALERSPIELPDPFNWTYFQASPPDQRIGPLRGDEWLRLEGIHHEIPQLDARLPSAWVTASLFGQDEALLSGQPIRVGLDSIQVDTDHGTCALVFRGYTLLPAGRALEELQIFAGLGLPDRPPLKLGPPLVARQKPTPPPQALPVSASPSCAETCALDEEMLQKLAGREAMPFHQGAAPQMPASSRAPSAANPPDPSGTFALDEGMLARLAERRATPFDVVPRKAPPAPPAPPSPPVPSPPKVEITCAPVLDVAGTLALDEELLARLAAGPAIPFAGGVPAPPGPDLSDLPWALPFQSGQSVVSARATLGAHFLAAMEESLRTKETGPGLHGSVAAPVTRGVSNRNL